MQKRNVPSSYNSSSGRVSTTLVETTWPRSSLLPQSLDKKIDESKLLRLNTVPPSIFSEIKSPQTLSVDQEQALLAYVASLRLPSAPTGAFGTAPRFPYCTRKSPGPQSYETVDIPGRSIAADNLPSDIITINKTPKSHSDLLANPTLTKRYYTKGGGGGRRCNTGPLYRPGFGSDRIHGGSLFSVTPSLNWNAKAISQLPGPSDYSPNDGTSISFVTRVTAPKKRLGGGAINKQQTNLKHNTNGDITYKPASQSFNRFPLSDNGVPGPGRYLELDNASTFSRKSMPSNYSETFLLTKLPAGYDAEMLSELFIKYHVSANRCSQKKIVGKTVKTELTHAGKQTSTLFPTVSSSNDSKNMNSEGTSATSKAIVTTNSTSSINALGIVNPYLSRPASMTAAEWSVYRHLVKAIQT